MQGDGSLKGIYGYNPESKTAWQKNKENLEVDHDRMVMLKVKYYPRSTGQDTKGHGKKVSYVAHHPHFTNNFRTRYMVEYHGEFIEISFLQCAWVQFVASFVTYFCFMLSEFIICQDFKISNEAK